MNDLRYPILLYTLVTPNSFCAACMIDCGSWMPPIEAVTLALRLATNTVKGTRVAKSHVLQPKRRKAWKRRYLVAIPRVMGRRRPRRKILVPKAISAQMAVMTEPLR